MHGTTEADYQRELGKAQIAGKNDRVNALQVAKDVIEALEFEHLNSSMDLIRVCEMGLKRIEILAL